MSIDWSIYGDQTRCLAEVRHRDCYRRTGRGKTGFELHYTHKQCQRKADESGYCWQHKKATTP